MTADDFFIDFHCHSGMKAFGSSTKHSEKINLWVDIPPKSECSDLKNWIKKSVKETVKYSQINLDECKKGRVGVVFNSIYPIEKGWFDKSFISGVIIKKKNFIKSAICSSGLDENLVKDTVAKIDDNAAFLYFDEFLKEYYYLTSAKAESDKPENKFFIANSFDDIKKVKISHNETVIALVLNMEGGHSLLNFDSYTDLKHTPYNFLNNTYTDEYKKYHKQITEHIEILKGLKSASTEIDGQEVSFNIKHTPFYVTVAHHFWNLLTGHADSIPFGADILLNQRRGMEKKFTLLGIQLLKKLLDRGEGKRRILIDIKHLSISARKQFYKFRRDEYVVNDDNFPIIASHTAINGRETYDYLFRDEREEIYFNTSDINLFDNDIEEIFKSGGMIGLILNESRLPGLLTISKLKRLKRKLENAETEFEKQKISFQIKEIYLNCITVNIFHIVKVINKKEAWDIISIGSDFDGMINALDDYTKASDFERLYDDLLEYMDDNTALPQINMFEDEMKHLKFDLSNSQILDKIFYANALNFMKKYFHDDYLMKGNIH